MAFRHPLRNEFDRIFRDLDKHSHQRGLNAVIARTHVKLLRPFVEQLEFEREVDAHPHHFLHAMIALVSNELAATLKFTLDEGQQLDALKSVMSVIQDQVAARLDKPAQSHVFFAGFDPQREKLTKNAAAGGAAA